MMRPIRLIALTQVTTMLLLGCAAARIETHSHAEGRIESVRTVYVLPVRFSRTEPGNLEGPADLDLHARAVGVLTTKGYSMVPAEESDIRMAIRARIDRVTRRTWSSDPDASALRDVAVNEAVIVVDVFDDTSTEAIWNAEARSRLPDRDSFLGPTRRDIWHATLRDAVQAFPAASAGETKQ